MFKRGSPLLLLSCDHKVMGTVGLWMAELVFPPRATQSSHPQLLALCWVCPFLETISRWGPEGSGRALGPHHLLWLGIMFCNLQPLLSFLPDAGLCPLCAGLCGEMIWWQQPQWTSTDPEPNPATQWADTASTDLNYWEFLLTFSSNKKKCRKHSQTAHLFPIIMPVFLQSTKPNQGCWNYLLDPSVPHCTAAAVFVVKWLSGFWSLVMERRHLDLQVICSSSLGQW